MKWKNNIYGFTLIEVLLSILIISSVLITAFYAMTFITIGKVRLIESTKIEKEWFYFSEKLFEMIKGWWVLDFEEYFNRSIVGDTTFSSGHFDRPTWYGNFWYAWTIETNNFWANLYYCRSANRPAPSMGTGWCVNSNNTRAFFVDQDRDYSGQPQRHWQYAFQFIDYNSDRDGNNWDEDNDWDFFGDDDDAFIGQWPSVFIPNTNINELYLISGDRKTRTHFRWNVWIDPDRPTWADCSHSSTPESPTGTGCLGTIEFLVMNGRDWWLDHSISGPADSDGSQYDGIIDTWVIDPRFASNATTVAGSNTEYYRESLFPDTISVSDFEIYAFPHKDIELAWKDGNSAINQAPYIKLKLTLSPSWKKRKIISGKVPQVEIATTISLNDEFSK